jgi:DNA-damage-inducible protein J
MINIVNHRSFDMASNALVTTRINENIKSEATEVLASMGLTVSDAVRLMLTKVAKEKALPFEIWQPNAETIAAMQEDLTHAKAFHSVADLMADLNADD